MQSIANKAVSRIYGHGRGWVFTAKDLADCGSPDAIEKALARLKEKSTIRQVLRGIYHYPSMSKLFNEPSSPDPDKLAQAIARNHGWTIIPSGETALNLLGLSTQVPGKYTYFSDGPSKQYAWTGGELIFKKRALRETGSLSARTAIIVQALKALGKEHISETVIEHLGVTLSKNEIKTALNESRYVTAWVYEAIKEIAKIEEKHG